jgi:hypothetical protein
MEIIQCVILYGIHFYYSGNSDTKELQQNWALKTEKETSKEIMWGASWENQVAHED